MRYGTILAILLVAGLCMLRPPQPHSEVLLAGTVTKVRDGETIEVRGVPVRLQGLTCEEKHTALGQAATIAITDLAAGFFVSCTLTGQKSFGREIGYCSLGDGNDLGAELIALGLCGRCDRFDVGEAYVATQGRAGSWRGAFPSYCQPRS